MVTEAKAPVDSWAEFKEEEKEEADLDEAELPQAQDRFIPLNSRGSASTRGDRSKTQADTKKRKERNEDADVPSEPATKYPRNDSIATQPVPTYQKAASLPQPMAALPPNRALSNAPLPPVLKFPSAPTPNLAKPSAQAVKPQDNWDDFLEDIGEVSSDKSLDEGEWDAFEAV